MSDQNSYCTFDDAVPRCVRTLREHMPNWSPEDTRIIRDIDGRVHLVFRGDVDAQVLQEIETLLMQRLGPWLFPTDSVAVAKSTIEGEALFDEATLTIPIDDDFVKMIDRRAVGPDWSSLSPLTDADTAPANHPTRLVFYSLKGGVGRSTAVILTARHLADAGKKILLIDLDLEAPGIATQVLADAEMPRFGVLDWLVEDLVRNDGPDDHIIDNMIASAPVVGTAVNVVAAVGLSPDGSQPNVVSKLARAYLERYTQDGEVLSFSARLMQMVSRIETVVKPDVVLVDSRSGLHESVASVLLHMDAEVLLFGTDLPASWQGYRLLFAHLAQLASDSAAWRERLKMVRALAPPSSPRESAKTFLSTSYGLWTDSLYDQIDAQGGLDEVTNEEFSFDENDPDAPHSPLTIHRTASFQDFDARRQLSETSETAVREAFAPFLTGLTELLDRVASP